MVVCECDVEGRTVEVLPIIFCKKCKKKIVEGEV
jgi:hypothetical protein